MNTFALVLRPLIAVLFFAIFVLFVLTMGYGRAYVVDRRQRLYTLRMVELLETHQRLARWVLWLTIVAVVLTETYVLVAGRVLPRNWFFYLHLSTSIMYAIGTWKLTHGWNGFKKPSIHKKVAYATVAAFGIAYIIGHARLFHEVTRELGFSWLLQ